MSIVYLGDEYDDEDFDMFGPYPNAGFMHEEEYTGRPLEETNTCVGSTHHPDCPDPEVWECCKQLWLADYETKKEREAEDLHQEWWQ